MVFSVSVIGKDHYSSTQQLEAEITPGQGDCILTRFYLWQN